MAPRRSRAQRPSSQDLSRRRISYPTSPTRTASKAPHNMAAFLEPATDGSAGAFVERAISHQVRAGLFCLSSASQEDRGSRRQRRRFDQVRWQRSSHIAWDQRRAILHLVVWRQVGLDFKSVHEPFTIPREFGQLRAHSGKQLVRLFGQSRILGPPGYAIAVEVDPLGQLADLSLRGDWSDWTCPSPAGAAARWW